MILGIAMAGVVGALELRPPLTSSEAKYDAQLLGDVARAVNSMEAGGRLLKLALAKAGLGVPNLNLKIKNQSDEPDIDSDAVRFTAECIAETPDEQVYCEAYGEVLVSQGWTCISTSTGVFCETEF